MERVKITHTIIHVQYVDRDAYQRGTTNAGVVAYEKSLGLGDVIDAIDVGSKASVHFTTEVEFQSVSDR